MGKTTKVRPSARPRNFAVMSRLKEFYRKYRPYIGTDVLMYAVFVLVLVLLFVFG